MTTTTAHEQIRPSWRRSAVVFWWLVLAASVAVSSYGNIRHAGMVVPADMLDVGRWIAGSLPVVLLVMVEGIALGIRGGVAGWQRHMATVFVGALGVVVLASSYVGLYSLVTATELFTVDVLNVGLAGVPDLLMIASTVYVMSLRRPADTAERVPSPSAWARIGGNLVARVEQATAPTDDSTAPTAPNVRSLDRPVESVDPAPVDRPTTPVDYVSESADRALDEPVDHSDEFNPTTPVDRGRPNSSTGPEQAVHLVERTPADRSTAPDEHADRRPIEPDEQPVESVEQAPVEQATGPVESDEQSDEVADRAAVDRSDEPDELSDDTLDRAGRVLAESSITADPTELARVLELDSAGWSRQRIADAVGRSKSTVSGWLKVAEEIDRPQLAAVR